MGEPDLKPNIDKCHACGKLFPRLYVALCGTCVLVDDNRFALVRDYLREQEGTAIAAIADGTGLSRGDIARFQSEGRLVSTEHGFSAAAHECACEPGSSARCVHCRRQLATRLRNYTESATGPAAESTPPSTEERTRYVRRIHRTE